MDTIRKNGRKGAALILVLAALLILLIWGVGYFSLSLNSRIFAIRDASKIAARSAADSGLTRALYEMNKMMLGSGGPKFMDAGAFPLIISGAWESDPAVTYTLRVDVNGPFINRIFDVTSTGTASGVNRKVSGIINLSSDFDYALLANTQIDLKNNNFVGYNPNDPIPQLDPLKIATNGVGYTQLAPVMMGNNTVIDGDIMVAPGVGPPLVNGGAVNGQAYNVDEPFPLPTVTVTPPSLVSALSNGQMKGTNYTISTSGKWDSIDLGKNTLTINGNVTLYVTGEINFGKNGADLIINNNSSLILYAGGNIDMQNKIVLNGTEGPASLQILGLPTCTSIYFKNGGDVQAVVRAPDADVYMKNNGDFYGALIAKSFEFHNGGTFYYDSSLRTKIVVQGTKFVLRRFWEN